MQVLCETVQLATGNTVKLAWADQGYTGEQAKQAAKEAGIDLQVVKLPEAKKGFVLLARFRRLSRDFERLPEVLAGLHFVVFLMLMLPGAARRLALNQSPQRALGCDATMIHSHVVNKGRRAVLSPLNAL